MLNYILARLHAGEEGQTMAEYAVVLAVITIAILVVLGTLSGSINDALQTVSDKLGEANAG